MKFGLVSSNNPCCCKGKPGYFFFGGTQKESANIIRNNKLYSINRWRPNFKDQQYDSEDFRDYVMYTLKVNHHMKNGASSFGHDKPSTYKNHGETRFHQPDLKMVETQGLPGHMSISFSWVILRNFWRCRLSGSHGLPICGS